MSRHIAFLCALAALLAAAALSRALLPATEAVDGKWLRIRKTPDIAYATPGEAATFTIFVLNTSQDQIVKDIIIEDPLAPECNAEYPALLEGLSFSYTCQKRNVLAPFTNEATVRGTNATTLQQDTASDTARVEILDLGATFSAEPAEVMVPGGPVTFTVAITNSGSTAVQLTSLVSPQLGDLTDPDNNLLLENSCAQGDLPTLASEGGVLQCMATADVTGASGTYSFELDAAGFVAADSSVTVSAEDTAEVNLFDIFVTSLSAEEDAVPTGGKVRLLATIENQSPTQSIRVTSLQDSVAGDVRPYGDCVLPQLVVPGGIYACGYELVANGAVGEEKTFVLNVTAETMNVPPFLLQGQGDATVSLYEPRINLPVLAHVPRPGTCGEALNIKINTRYHFPHDLENAYYRFVLAEALDVTVEVTEFQTDDGQVIVYAAPRGTCEGLQFLRNNGIVAPEMPVALGELEPGTYYARVLIAGERSKELVYSLYVRAD